MHGESVVGYLNFGNSILIQIDNRHLTTAGFYVSHSFIENEKYLMRNI